MRNGVNKKWLTFLFQKNTKWSFFMVTITRDYSLNNWLKECALLDRFAAKLGHISAHCTLHAHNSLVISILDLDKVPKNIEKYIHAPLIILRTWIQEYHIKVKFLPGAINRADIETKDVQPLVSKKLYAETVLGGCTNMLSKCKRIFRNVGNSANKKR